MENEYDYVIVGAGAAGCVLANRLSADPSTQVLLVEAGGSTIDPLIRVPKGLYFLLGGGKYAYHYQTLPAGPQGAVEHWVRGKLGSRSRREGHDVLFATSSELCPVVAAAGLVPARAGLDNAAAVAELAADGRRRPHVRRRGPRGCSVRSRPRLRRCRRRRKPLLSFKRFCIQGRSRGRAVTTSAQRL